MSHDDDIIGVIIILFLSIMVTLWIGKSIEANEWKNRCSEHCKPMAMQTESVARDKVCSCMEAKKP